MSEKSNLYALLGLSRDATAEEIRRAYHEAARRLHPDVNSLPGETELFLSTKKAYEILSDPVQRAAYNAQLELETARDRPIKINTLFSRESLLKINEPQLIYTILDLEAPTAPGGIEAGQANLPLNVALVLDRSTSMQGERMDTVKSAAIELIRQLHPGDILSIIVFSDRAQVLLAAERQLDRDEIETQIRMIQPGGGTEILRGLQAGFFEVRRNLSKGRINHIVLLTDGRTYGDDEGCLNLADKAAALGIGISGLGIGTEWNDAFLDALATRTGGHSAYITKLADIQNFLHEKFQGLGQVFAEQISFDLQTGPGVSLRYAFRLHPEAMQLPVEFPIWLGNIPNETGLSILLEFMIDPISTGVENVLLGSGNLSVNIPSLVNSSKNMWIELSRPVGQSLTGDQPPRAIIQALSNVTLYRMQDRARQDVAEGDLRKASRRLQNLATHLLAQGKRDLAHTVLMEADHLHNNQTLTGEGEKRIKYGTRALLFSNSEED